MEEIVESTVEALHILASEAHNRAVSNIRNIVNMWTPVSYKFSVFLINRATGVLSGIVYKVLTPQVWYKTSNIKISN